MHKLVLFLVALVDSAPGSKGVELEALTLMHSALDHSGNIR